MKIVCVGGGPAGLYFAISMKLHNKEHDIIVVERNPAGVAYGWGVVFWDDMLDNLYDNDPKSAREIRDSSVLWDNQQVHTQAKETVYLGEYGYSIGRKRLLDILAKRAMDLGVDVRFGREVEDPSEFAEADLIVACAASTAGCASSMATTSGPRSTWAGTSTSGWAPTRCSSPSPSLSRRRRLAGSGSTPTASTTILALASSSALQRPGRA